MKLECRKEPSSGVGSCPLSSFTTLGLSEREASRRRRPHAYFAAPADSAASIGFLNEICRRATASPLMKNGVPFARREAENSPSA
jgi:hypothetical protein